MSRDIVDDKFHRHLAVGGNRSNDKLQQYLEGDRKVLRFQCYWDDETRYGSRVYYTLHFYLADDTVEILEFLARNSGRDPYPVFWTRSKMRKNPQGHIAPGMLEPDAILYLPEDFLVGQSIEVYHRKIVLYDCDVFTREFYRARLGIEQGKIEINTPGLVHAALHPPPHMGLGTEEDSLGNVQNLVPKPPARDINKLMTDADKLMRFEAVLVNNMPEDEHRKFVIIFFLADETVGVWELKTRNSGFMEGKFAGKGRKKNQSTGQWFKPIDFYIGANIEVHAGAFLITKADEGTLKYMEKHCDQFPVASVDTILAKVSGLREHLAQVESVRPEEIQQLAYDALGMELVEHELVTLSRALGEQEPSGLIYTSNLLESLQ